MEWLKSANCWTINILLMSRTASDGGRTAANFSALVLALWWAIRLVLIKTYYSCHCFSLHSFVWISLFKWRYCLAFFSSLCKRSSVLFYFKQMFSSLIFYSVSIKNYAYYNFVYDFMNKTKFYVLYLYFKPYNFNNLMTKPFIIMFIIVIAETINTSGLPVLMLLMI